MQLDILQITQELVDKLAQQKKQVEGQIEGVVLLYNVLKQKWEDMGEANGNAGITRESDTDAPDTTSDTSE